MNKIKITYRGWIGHFILGYRCVFRLNTLVESGDIRVIVSTVGKLLPKDFFLGKGGDYETISYETYYETMVFRATLAEEYYWDWDGDSDNMLSIKGKHRVDHMDITSDKEAQEMHEAAVQEIVDRICSGEIS